MSAKLNYEKFFQNPVFIHKKSIVSQCKQTLYFACFTLHNLLCMTSYAQFTLHDLLCATYLASFTLHNILCIIYSAKLTLHYLL